MSSAPAARGGGGVRAVESAHRDGEPYITVQVLGPDGEKVSLKVKRSDDVSTMRALITQMWVAPFPSSLKAARTSQQPASRFDSSMTYGLRGNRGVAGAWSPVPMHDVLASNCSLATSKFCRTHHCARGRSVVADWHASPL